MQFCMRPKQFKISCKRQTQGGMEGETWRTTLSATLNFQWWFPPLGAFHMGKNYVTLQKCSSYNSPVSATLGTNPTSRHLSPGERDGPAPFTPRLLPGSHPLPPLKNTFHSISKAACKNLRGRNLIIKINAIIYQR